MNIKELSQGIFGFDFKYYCKGLHVSSHEQYIVRIMADSQSDAVRKFHTHVRNLNTSRSIECIPV